MLAARTRREELVLPVPEGKQFDWRGKWRCSPEAVQLTSLYGNDRGLIVYPCAPIHHVCQ